MYLIVGLYLEVFANTTKYTYFFVNIPSDSLIGSGVKTVVFTVVVGQ